MFGVMVDGYEIHNARAKKNAKSKKNIYATFVHGIFDNNEFRYKIFSEINKNYKGYDFQKYKKEKIEEYATFIEKHIDIKKIIKAIK
jgi:adenosylcobyric acid synthase